MQNTVFILAILLVFSVAGITTGQDNSVDDNQEAQRRVDRLEQTIFRNPMRGTAFNLWFQHHTDSGTLTDTLSSIRERSIKQPNHYAIQVILGLISERLGNTDDAIAAYSRAAGLGERYYPRMLLGTLWHRQHEFEKAIPELKKALELELPRTDALATAKMLATSYMRIERARSRHGNLEYAC